MRRRILEVAMWIVATLNVVVGLADVASGKHLNGTFQLAIAILLISFQLWLERMYALLDLRITRYNERLEQSKAEAEMARLAMAQFKKQVDAGNVRMAAEVDGETVM